MANMIDSKPSRQGEAVVWQSFCDNLPNSYVVYYNRVITTHEYDFLVMIEGIGLFVVEVKGWTPDYVVNVINSKSIVLKDHDAPVGSPRSQATAYRYELVSMLEQKFNYKPPVFEMVCYPFISKDIYYQKGLNTVSNEILTILAEDLEDPVKLKDKFLERYKQAYVKNFDTFDHRMFAAIRHYFEPNYNYKEEVKQLNPGYSRLRTFASGASEQDIFKLSSEYFDGIKEVVLVPDAENLRKIAETIETELKKRNLKADRNTISIGTDEFDSNILTSSYTIFNFEAYVCPQLSEITSDDLLIEEGKTTSEEKNILEKIADATDFNAQQYQIEHAPAEKNILVTAGAGTGKTYSMVSRIAFLCNRIEEPVADIVNDIAMITFTNDAANNMKKRLKRMFMNYFVLTSKQKYLKYIDDLSQIQISTIHKFSMEILRKACIHLGLGNEFEISSETYNRKQFYHARLNDYLEKKVEENPSFTSQQLLPAYQIETILEDFSDKLYNKSIDIKEVSSDAFGDCEGLSYFNELIKEVMIPAEIDYSGWLKSRNLVNLRQCMIIVNELVNSNHLDKYGMAFRYLFVDEFQDTDDVQIHTILRLQKLFGSQCRLFVVGDLKQSIYRFRGATLSAFAKVQRGAEWISFSLNTNYRTDARLLEKYEPVFEKMGKSNLLPYEVPGDQLKSHIRKQYKENDLVHVIKVNSKQPELFYQSLFNEIKFQIDSIKELSEKDHLSSEERIIAILTRYNYEIQDIAKMAKNYGVAVEVAEGGDLFRQQSTIDLYKLVLALTNSGDTAMLTNLIKSSYIAYKEPLINLHNLDNNQKEKELLHILDQYFLTRMGKNWDHIIADFQTRPILVILREIYESFQPWKHYSIDPDKQLSYRENYECLLEQITQKYRRDFLTLNMVGDYLKLNITTWQEKPSRQQENANNNVRVICTTIHKSKGLEYGTVVLPFTSENFDSEKASGTNVNMIDGKLSYKIVTDNNIVISNDFYQPEEEQHEHSKEECRILYVAMTRAIRNFVWLKDEDRKYATSWGGMLEVNE